MDLTGRTIGQYQLVELIHQGENTVFKGFQASMNRYVAVKILSPARANDPLFGQQFQRDMQLIAGLQHPNILPIYDYGQQDGLLYMVTEYVEGGTLQDRMASYRSPYQAKQMVNAIVGALEHIHHQGTIHGNLKPSNILIDQQGQPLLTDFGYTQGIDVGAGENVYLSPELAQGGPYDQRTDVYALGVLLYEMLVGSPPPMGTAPNLLAMRPDLPIGVEQIIVTAMAPYPEQRYQTVGEFSMALDQALPAQAAAATAQLEQGSTKLWIWGGVAVVALLAIMACALLFFFGFFDSLFGSGAGDKVAAGTPVSGGVIIILPTPAPGAPSVTATTNVNIRTGPGTQYPRIGILPAGQSAEVIGVSSDNAWWAIKVPPEAIKVSYLNTDDASLRLSAFARSKVKPRPVTAYSGNGWVSAEYVAAQSTDNVPVIQPPPVPTATPVPPVDFTGWQGEYFNNRELQGNPVLVRDDPKITFNWGVGSPGPEVPVDNFSARWNISRDAPEGIYRFSIWADNGVRLWIDDGLVINGWVEGPPRNFYTRVKLNQGIHRVRVEYFHAAGEAMIELEVGYDKEEPQPQPPKAAINGTTQAQVGQPVFFNARNSQVAEGSHIKTFEWDFGDGSTATGVDVSHVYGETGTHEVQLKVTDDKDLSNTATHQINIVEGPVTPEPTNTPAPGKPVAAISGSAEASVGQKVSFDASASQCEGGCQSYLWAFGDGDTANAVTVDHTYRQAGEFFVKLVVTDGNNTSSDEATHRIVVTEQEPGPTDVPTPAPTEEPTPQPTEESQPPTAVIDGPSTAEVGVPVTFSCQDSDPGEGGNRIAQCLWNFGDGTAGQPGSPTVSYTYQQASGEIGYTVTLTVTNEKGLEDTTSSTIMVMAGPSIE